MLTERRHNRILIKGGCVPNLRSQSCAIGEAFLHANQGRADIRRCNSGRITGQLVTGEAIAFCGAEGELLARHFFRFFSGGDAERKVYKR